MSSARAHVSRRATPTCTPPSRRKGYRLTPQRQLVLDAVARLEHGTPGRDLRRGAAHGAPGVNISTVYRTLELLEELGAGHPRPPRPRRADLPRGRDGDHLHLVCRDCGAVAETDVARRRRAGRPAGRPARLRDRRRALRDLRPLPGVLDRDQPAARPRRAPSPPTRRTTASPRTTATRSASSARSRPGEASVDLSHRAVVRIAGPDRLTWLHSLTSQHLERLAPGRADRGARPVPARATSSTPCYLVDDGEATWAHVEPGTAEDAGRLPGLDAVLVEGRGRRRVPGVRRGAARPSRRRRGAPYPGHRRTGSESFVPRADLATVLAGPLAGVWALRGAARSPTAGRGSAGDRPPHDPARGRLARDRRAPGQGLLPRAGDRRPGAQPRPAAAPAGAAAPRRQRRRRCPAHGAAGDAGRPARSAS